MTDMFPRFCLAIIPLLALAGCNTLPGGAVQPLPEEGNLATTPGAFRPPVPELVDIKSALNLSEKTIILVTGAPARYTSYMLENPNRLAVEMRQTSSRIASAPILVEDDLVEKITVLEFKKAEVVRVEIALKREAKHAVVTTEAGIEIKLFSLEESRDPSVLAGRLVKAEADLAALARENEELKALLERSNQRLRENQAHVAHVEDKAMARELASQPGWKEKAAPQILESLENWRKALEEKDLDAYMSMYSTEFQAGEQDLGQWLEGARPIFEHPGGMQARILDRRIRISGGTARVKFKLRLTPVGAASGAAAESPRTMDLGWTRQGWRIEAQTGGTP